MRFEELLKKFESVSKHDTFATVRCPFHQGLALSVFDDKKGRLYFKCSQDCPTEAILNSLGLTFDDLKYDSIPATGAMVAPEKPIGNHESGHREFPATDAGNAELFAARYGDKIRYDATMFRWLEWKGHWWEPMSESALYNYAKLLLRQQGDASQQIAEDSKRQWATKWYQYSEASFRLDALINLARKESPTFDCEGGWDEHPWLLGVDNGIVDLKTGTLRQGNPADRVTMHMEVSFDPNAKCDRWVQFIGEIFGGDPELIHYVQKAVGYSLTGEVSEQCFFFLHGDGENGKSTFLEILLHLLGPYGHTLPESVLEKRSFAISNEIAAIPNKRLIVIGEVREGQLNENLLKALTGGDQQRARRLYKESFEFHPVGKIWFAANRKPEVKDTSHGFWRRVRLIPFKLRVAADKKDLQLKERLLESEASGILRWAVEGAVMYAKEGLSPVPAAITEATESYHEEMDDVGRFLEDRCVAGDGMIVGATDLFKAYLYWCEETGVSKLSQKNFGDEMTRRGFVRKPFNHGLKAYKNLGLKPEPG